MCIALSVVATKYRWIRASRNLKCFAIVWILLCSQPYFSDLLLYPLEKPVGSQRQKEKPDVIFVLACYYSTEGDVSEIARWSECSLQRNVEAARLHFQTGSPILITGGYFLYDEDVNFSDKAMALFRSLNINAEYLIATREGTTTAEEIKSARKWLEDRNVWVVSSASHIKRLDKMLKPIAKNVAFFPVDFQTKGSLTPYLTFPSQVALENTRRAFYAYLADIKHRLTDN